MTRMRSSVRSRDSSSTSTGVDPRERVKDCCRKLVAFMCTQVGVGGLVVGYAIVGAMAFIAIEKNAEYIDLTGQRLKSALALWNRTAGNQSVNILDKKAFDATADEILLFFQRQVVGAVKKGYNGQTTKESWTIPAALMFCLSVFTMIGYGNLVPRTPWGRGATVVYAIFGIPLYVLYFLNMGKVLAHTFRWLYTRMHQCTGKKKPGTRIIVPSTACLWVLSGYILAGTITFAQWEGWGYLDSAYFCVTSLCKIGIGDFVPGTDLHDDNRNESQTKLVINFVYLLFGLGLVAMCYNLMREEVRVKARQLSEDVKKAFDDFRHKIMMSCCPARLE